MRPDTPPDRTPDRAKDASPAESQSEESPEQLTWEEAREQAGEPSATRANPSTPRVNPFTGEDVVTLLRERGWLADSPEPTSPPQLAWCERAAFLLGAQVSDRAQLAELLGLVFHYDAAEVLAKVEAHLVMSRYAARDVLRRSALELLDNAPLTPERFSAIITTMKESMEPRGRELFHPIRLALTGRSGEGALDRVLLLLDDAANAAFAVPVKSARTRILEFCSAFV
jgi:hypothetical protein